MGTTVTLLAVISRDGFISRGRGVPWILPIDKAHFRAYAAGKWCLLGRTTFEEMHGWFSDHHPLILSRDPHYQPPVGQRVSSSQEAIALAHAAQAPELVVIGGSSVFDATMPVADRLEITHVDDTLGDGVAFPAIAPDVWRATSRKAYPQDEQHAHAFEIVTYQRAAPQRH